MQNCEQLILELFSHIKIFENKLRLWHTQLLEGNICHFPTVLQVLGDNISREKVLEFAHQIDCILSEFRERFGDFRTQETNLNIFLSPFHRDIEHATALIQMELIELKEDLNLRAKFQNVALSNFYSKHLPSDKFPNFVSFAQRIIPLFGSTYLCEQFFSRMKAQSRHIAQYLQRSISRAA